MKKMAIGMACLPILPLLLSGCSLVGSRGASLSVIYAATALLAMAILVGYAVFSKKINLWQFGLFLCVTVVNTGYFALSVSATLEAALWCNRLAYLGSVFLPLTMLMIILSVCKITPPKWLLPALLSLSAVVFALTASPGIAEVYYREVSLKTVHGVTALEKVYGPLHSVYLYYLMGYFAAMIATTLFARYKDKTLSVTHASLLLVSTLINIAVWLLEQLVSIDFEFLAVSYIISELFLLGVDVLVRDVQSRPVVTVVTPAAGAAVTESIDFTDEQYRYFVSQLPRLTPTERMVYDLYAEGKSSKDILVEMNFKENTLKYHNRNIYSKLGVSTRKQLKSLAAAVNSRSE